MVGYTVQLQRIVRAYRTAGNPWPTTARGIAAWAIGNDLWQPQRSALIGQCTEEISRAMREEYFTDPQGRRVRAKHSARMSGQDGEQGRFWDDIRTAPREHMRIAFQQRRRQIVGNCHQLKTDMDSFNENNTPLDPIQMKRDFTKDLEELEAAPV